MLWFTETDRSKRRPSAKYFQRLSALHIMERNGLIMADVEEIWFKIRISGRIFCYVASQCMLTIVTLAEVIRFSDSQRVSRSGKSI